MYNTANSIGFSVIPYPQSQASMLLPILPTPVVTASSNTRPYVDPERLVKAKLSAIKLRAIYLMQRFARRFLARQEQKRRKREWLAARQQTTQMAFAIVQKIIRKALYVIKHKRRGPDLKSANSCSSSSLSSHGLVSSTDSHQVVGSVMNQSAILIQRWFRGYMARKVNTPFLAPLRLARERENKRVADLHAKAEARKTWTSIWNWHNAVSNTPGASGSGVNSSIPICKALGVPFSLTMIGMGNVRTQKHVSDISNDLLRSSQN
jgi:hypothetical protein